MKRMVLALCLPVLLLACDTFFEQNIAEKQVVIIGPKDGSVLETGTVTFAWRALEHASAYRITIVAPDFQHAAWVVADTLLRNDTLRMAVSYARFLMPGEYQWSIQASNTAYAAAEQLYSLTIIPHPEPEPNPDPDPNPDDGSDDGSGEPLDV